MQAGAAVLHIVRTEDLLVGAGIGHTHLVAFAQDGVEVADHHDHLAFGVAAQESNDGLLVVIRHDPLEAFPAVIHLPHGGGLGVEAVQILDVLLQLLVLFVAEEHPVQRFLFVPLDELAELLAHEQQLFARMGEHVAVEGTQVGELGLIVAGHLVDEAALAVHHLVMADGQHKILAEGVEEAEGHLAMIAGAEQRVGLHVGEHVVHPAHVPLEVKPKAAVRRGLGHQRPCGGFLGDHHFVGMAGQDGGVHLLQEGDGLQIFLAAVLVLLPLAVLAVVVQIQHAGHRVHAQTVHMVLLDPEQRAGHQEALHLIHAIVEHHGTPFLMLAAAGVGILVAGLTVEHVQAVAVLGEVGGHPVQDHADTSLMELVHKGHEIMGRAVAAGGGKITGDLIAPGSVKGIFGDGQQLHVGVAHFLDVGDQLVRQFGIVIGNLIFRILHLPAAGVHLIDGHRSVDDIFFLLLRVPLRIAPLVAADVIHLAAVGGAGLGMESVGIRLIAQFIVAGGDAIFVHIVLLDSGNKQLPDAAVLLNLGHGMRPRNPAVEIAHNGHCFGVRCPDTEHRARLSVLLTQMRAKVTVRLKIAALVEQVNGQIGMFRFGLLLFHLDLPFGLAAERRH